MDEQTRALLTEDEINEAVKDIQHPVLSWWLDIIKLELQAQLSKVLKAGYKNPGEIEGEIQEAKKQEREGIIKLLEKEYPAITTWQCWQTLKSTNKGGGE